MTQTITYASAVDAPAWTETIPTTRRDDFQLVESAESGAVGTGAALIDDPNGDVGHLADGIVGWKPFYVDNDAMSPSRLFTGFTFDRGYTRGPYSEGDARQIAVTLHDENVLLGLREITGTDGKRPAETIAQRITWLLGSAYMSGVEDSMGWVGTFTRKLDEADYTTQYPGDVLADCASQAGVSINHFVRYDPYSDTFALWFDDPNSSTNYSTDLRISNVIADVDGDVSGLTFYPSKDARLQRTPERVVSGAAVAYARGYQYVTRAATAAAFIARDRPASNSNVKTATAARRIGRRFLAENATEDDRIGVSIIVPESEASSIHAGMRIEVKFTHLFPRYATFTWCRILQVSKAHLRSRDNLWELTLELVPQEIVNACDEAADINTAATIAQVMEVTSGATVAAPATISGWFGGPVDYPVADIPFSTLASSANDSDESTYAGIVNTFSVRHTGCIALRFTSTFDGTYTLCSTKGVQSGYQNSPDRIEYWDGAAWVEATGAYVFTGIFPDRWTYTFAEEIETTKLRLTYTFCGVSGIFGLWGAFPTGLHLYDWQVLGT